MNKLVVNPEGVLTGDHIDMLATLPHKKILEQSTKALNFLHGLGLVHRNLHPNNFLIQCVGKEKDLNKYAVKLTDFQLAKDWENSREDSNRHPMTGWRAVPECNPPKNDKKERDSKSDVYTLGCYFYFVLSGGKHPFGKEGDSSIYSEESLPYKEGWNPNSNGENWVNSISTFSIFFIVNIWPCLS